MRTVAMAFVLGTALLGLMGCGSEEPAVTPEARKISCEQLTKWQKVHVATQGLLEDADSSDFSEDSWYLHLVSQSVDEELKIEELEKVCYAPQPEDDQDPAQP